jgi:hypothetical protein
VTTALGILVLLALGYTLGRYRPAHRTTTWARGHNYDRHLRRHSTRWWAVVVILTADNLTWLITHPVQGRHAWQHRNDPPPPRSPAVRINDRPGPR